MVTMCRDAARELTGTDHHIVDVITVMKAGVVSNTGVSYTRTSLVNKANDRAVDTHVELKCCPMPAGASQQMAALSAQDHAHGQRYWGLVGRCFHLLVCSTAAQQGHLMMLRGIPALYRLCRLGRRVAAVVVSASFVSVGNGRALKLSAAQWVAVLQKSLVLQCVALHLQLHHLVSQPLNLRASVQQVARYYADTSFARIRTANIQHPV
jgi:hypothetical protein